MESIRSLVESSLSVEEVIARIRKERIELSFMMDDHDDEAQWREAFMASATLGWVLDMDNVESPANAIRDGEARNRIAIIKNR